MLVYKTKNSRYTCRIIDLFIVGDSRQADEGMGMNGGYGNGNKLLYLSYTDVIIQGSGRPFRRCQPDLRRDCNTEKQFLCNDDSRVM
jgi:hypothetical protein